MPAAFQAPADFADKARSLATAELAALYGVQPRTIRKLRDRFGIKSPPQGRDRRNVPDDFSEVARTLGFNALVRHYSTGNNTVKRWLLETGLHRPRRDYSAPDWFATDAPAMSLKQAMQRGAVSLETVYKWEQDTGSRCRRGALPKPPKVRKPRPVKQRTVAKPKLQDFVRQERTPTRHFVAKATRQPVNPTNRDTSDIGRAAEYLARWCPVYRCNDEGRQSQGGRFWRVGTAVLTNAEVLARAERKGWVADSWSRIAA